MEKEISVFEKRFDYEDMKIAMVVQEFYNKHQMQEYETYEQLIELCIEIRKAWEDLEQDECSEEEYAYVQYFAENYLFDKFLVDTKKHA